MNASRYADTVNALEAHRARIRQVGLECLAASFECRHAIARLEVRVAAIGRWLKPRAWSDTAGGLAVARAQVSLARGAVDHARTQIEGEAARMAGALAEHPELATAHASAADTARAALDRVATALDTDRDRLEARVAQHIEAAAAAMTAEDLAPLHTAEAQAAVERGLHRLRDMLQSLPQQLLVARIEMADDDAWIREADAVLAAVDVTIGLAPRVYRGALADPVNGWRHWSTIRRFESLLAHARAVIAEGYTVEREPPPRERRTRGGRDHWLLPELEFAGFDPVFESDPEGPFDAPDDGGGDFGVPDEFSISLRPQPPSPSCQDVVQHHAALFEHALENPPEGCRPLEGRQWIKCAESPHRLMVVVDQQVDYVCGKNPLLELSPEIERPSPLPPAPTPPAPAPPDPIPPDDGVWSAPWKGIETFEADVGKLLDETGDPGLRTVLDVTARLAAERAWFDGQIGEAQRSLDDTIARVGSGLEQAAAAVEDAPRPDFDAPVPGGDDSDTDYGVVFAKAFVEAGVGMIPVYGDYYDMLNLGCGMLTGYTLLGDPIEDAWDAASLLIAAFMPLAGRPQVAAGLALLRRALSASKGLPRAALQAVRRLYVTGRAGQASVEALLRHGDELARRSRILGPLAKGLDAIEPRLSRWYTKPVWSAGKSTARQFAIDVALDAAHEMTVTVADKGDDFAVQILIDGRPVDRNGDPVSPASAAAWMPIDALGADTLKLLEPR